MKTRIALLRGINVLGSRKLLMADLRGICSELGLRDPGTYIQSGNVLFESEKADAEIEDMICSAIEAAYGYDVKVLVRPPSLFQRVVKENPFPDADFRHLHVTLLASIPDPGLVRSIVDADYGEDTFVAKKDAVYIHCPGGYGRTKLHNNFFESKLRTAATTRNWRTINKLVEMAGGRA